MAFDKPVRVARFGGTSSTETANSTEPPSGKKDTGWILDEEPPSSYFNWLHYRAYKWFRWLDERLNDGGASTTFIASAPDVALTSDNGGTAIFQGADSGTDADKDGGSGILGGGSATGSGSSQAKLRAAVAGASGVTARVREDFIICDGSAGDEGDVQIEKPIDLQVDATVTQTAAFFAHNGDGRVLHLVGDSSDPVSPALRLNPQDPGTNTDPTGTDQPGDIYVRTDDAALHYHNDNLGRFQQLDSVIGAYAADSDTIIGTVGAATMFQDTSVDISYTIPAYSLRVGSLIKVRALGSFVWSAGTPVLQFWIGRESSFSGLGGLALTDDGDFMLEAMMVVTALGAPGAVRLAGWFVINEAGDSNAEKVQIQPATDPTPSTQADWLVGLGASWAGGAAGDSVQMTFLTVEVQ